MMASAAPLRALAARATPAQVLIIEDTPSLRLIYEQMLRSAGFEVTSAETAAAGLAQFRADPPDAMVLDMALPDADGLDVLAEVIAERPQTAIIVVTAHGSMNLAVQAMRAGAYDFLVKPIDQTRLLAAVDNALRARTDDSPPQGFGPKAQSAVISGSAPMREVEARIDAVARSMASVFITGESGTGKELAAIAIHQRSNRATGPFVPLNCGAIPAEAMESEVFGHLQGAFPGAHADRQGAAAAAEGGTLFLDEICGLDLSLQTKLLRFLQSSAIQPVGARAPRHLNVRIICATNRDPADAIRRGLLREDLYYRLHVVPIHLPPLRERGDDISAIAAAALTRYAAEEGKSFCRFDPEALDLLSRHNWPGNVRQLLNTVRNIVVLNEGDTVTRSMLPAEFLAPGGADPDRTTGQGPAPGGLSDFRQFSGRTLAEIERRVIELTLSNFGGSVPKAARALDVSASTIYRKLGAWERRAGIGD